MLQQNNSQIGRDAALLVAVIARYCISLTHFKLEVALNLNFPKIFFKVKSLLEKSKCQKKIIPRFGQVAAIQIMYGKVLAEQASCISFNSFVINAIIFKALF